MCAFPSLDDRLKETYSDPQRCQPLPTRPAFRPASRGKYGALFGGFFELRLGRFGVRDVAELLGPLFVLVVVEILE